MVLDGWNKNRIFTFTILVLLTSGMITLILLPSAQAAPTISLTPISGPAGTVVTITGTGFVARSVVTIMYDRIAITPVTSTTAGTFVTTVLVPETLPACANTIQATDSSGNTASTIFTVTGGSSTNCQTNTLIYAMGGYSGTGTNAQILNTVEMYNPGNGKWSTLTSMPTARYDLAAVPEFGSILGIITILSVISVIVISRKLKFACF